MKITLVSIPVTDQNKALTFYTDVLGFVKKHDIPIGDARWLTVVSPENPNGPELLLEPNGEYPAMKNLKEQLYKDRIPFTAFQVDRLSEEIQKLEKQGVTIVQPPTESPGAIEAIIDDTCGNLIALYEETGTVLLE